MKVFIRGHADPVDSDIAVVPPTTFGVTSIARGGEATAATATSDHGAPDLGIARFDTATLPSMLTVADGGLAHSEGPVQFVPVASAMTDVPSVVRGDVAGSDGVGGGEIARGSDLAWLDSNFSSYADHGWFIVPSADNEYGPAAYAAADDYGWSVAAGEFSTDWFVV